MTQATITLADAQGSPVNHSFVPMGMRSTKPVWMWQDQSQASPIGYWYITEELVSPLPPKAGESSLNRTYRVKIALSEPTLENVSNNTVSGIAPAPTLSYTPRAFVEFVIPERASLQNRKDLRKMLANLLAETQTLNLVENLQVPI
jgi:hypothetical protein